MGAERPDVDLPEPPQRTIDRLLQPLALFGEHKLAGAMVLMAAAVIGIAWAASPLHESYFAFLENPVGVRVGPTVLEKPLVLWINDGLMAIFFFFVGLEIKREVLAGELATLRKAALPGIAALGGMLVPALVFTLVVGDAGGKKGWGVPMATDIAFALGVLALLGNRVPGALKVFLTALAIVDDIGAVVVIALFYTSDLAVVSLVIGGLAFAAAIISGRLGVRHTGWYLALGIISWLGFLKSGVHATIAALLMAFAIPAGTRVGRDALISTLRAGADRLEAVPRSTAGVPSPKQQAVAEAVARTAAHGGSPLLALEYGLLVPVTFLVLPVFAFANAGVRVEGSIVAALSTPLALGIIAGLFVGKQLGVLAFAWLAVKLKIAELPRGVRWAHIHGAALLSGIGFTMALFIAGLAFPGGGGQLDTAKVGILSGSLLSGVLGWAALVRAGARKDMQREDTQREDMQRKDTAPEDDEQRASAAARA